MKVHTDLKELLEDFTLKMAEPWQGELNKHDFDFIEKYASSNSLASVEPEPLAKNKDSESKCLCSKPFIRIDTKPNSCGNCGKVI